MSPSWLLISPLIRLKSVVFPAPLGPRMPSTSPFRTSKPRSLSTRTAPKDFPRPRAESNTEVSPFPVIADALLRPGQRLHRLFGFEERIDSIVDNLQFERPLLALYPLPPEDRRCRHVRVRPRREIDRPDQGLHVRRLQCIAVGCTVQWVGRAPQSVDGNFPDRVAIAQRLRPLAPGLCL